MAGAFSPAWEVNLHEWLGLSPLFYLEPDFYPVIKVFFLLVAKREPGSAISMGLRYSLLLSII